MRNTAALNDKGKAAGKHKGDEGAKRVKRKGVVALVREII